jgi:hypothetical protein
VVELADIIAGRGATREVAFPVAVPAAYAVEELVRMVEVCHRLSTLLAAAVSSALLPLVSLSFTP